MNIKTGTEITCYINDEFIDDAKLQEENGVYYICQDDVEGDYCVDTLGYAYSWSINDGSKDEIKENAVYNLKAIQQKWDQEENES